MHADMLLRCVWDEHILFLKNLMPWLERARRARSNHAGDDPGGGHREVPTRAPIVLTERSQKKSLTPLGPVFLPCKFT